MWHYKISIKIKAIVYTVNTYVWIYISFKFQNWEFAFYHAALPLLSCLTSFKSQRVNVTEYFVSRFNKDTFQVFTSNSPLPP